MPIKFSSIFVIFSTLCFFLTPLQVQSQESEKGSVALQGDGSETHAMQQNRADELQREYAQRLPSQVDILSFLDAVLLSCREQSCEKKIAAIHKIDKQIIARAALALKHISEIPVDQKFLIAVEEKTDLIAKEAQLCEEILDAHKRLLEWVM